MSADEANDPGRPDDPYSRAQYRKLIAWTARIEREAPFLSRLLERAPDRSVVDFGCATGEHVAWFARDGCRAVGLDRSEAMIESADEHAARGQGRFVLGDALEAAALLAEESPFGLGLCLGNMLPHLIEDAELQGFVEAAHAVLAPGGRLLIQILNYAALLADGPKALPVNVRDGEDGERIVFVRVMTAAEHGRVLFFPTTLRLDPTSEEPMTVETTRRVELRAWSSEALTHAFEAHGFTVKTFGDMQGGAYDASSSHDLVLLAERSA